MNFPKHIQELLEKRYFLKNEAYKNYYGKDGMEDWDQLCKRVAKTVSKNNPLMENTYYKMLNSLEFLPNSPTLFGAGVPGICLSACFIAPMEDSIEGWANTFRVAMKIQTAGGGIGFPLHKLRPSGSPVRGKIAHAAGPIEFMKCWNQISRSFMQAVRNGANLGQMHVSHPDLEKFISCKDKDGELSSFNISVMVTDKFMEAVQNNGDHDFIWDGKIVKTVKAKELWNKICEHAWKTGEPGILFYDRMQESFPHNDVEVFGNPCLVGETLILTKEYGLVKIETLSKIKNLHTFDHESLEQPITKVWNSGMKECVEITLDNGKKLKCTPDHKFLTSEGKWEDSGSLLNKDLFRVKNCDWDGVIPSEYKNHDMTILGFIFGDGSYHKDSKRVKYVHIGEKDHDVTAYLQNSNASDQFDFEHKTPSKGAVPIKLGYCDRLFTEPLPTRNIPDFVKHLPKNEMYNFLKGLYSANGYVIDDGNSNKRICIKMTNYHLISELQEILSICDIDSNIRINKGKSVIFDNGIYECKDSYSLYIMDYESCIKFRDNIGFIQVYKNIKLENMLPDLKNKKRPCKFNRVVSIIPCGSHMVYDFTQPNSNCGNISGHITHNCAEANLPQLGACNLGSINLMKCLDARQQTFSFGKFEKLIQSAYVFLDDLIDINQYPTPEIDKIVKEYRQIGLGVMGLADLFIHLGYVYGSQESLDLTKRIFEFKNKIEQTMNKVLAKKRGMYPKCNKKEPRRNANTSVVAPTGTISMIAGVSAGIEPVFSFDPITRVIDGKETEIHTQLKHSNPEVNICANDVSVKSHIEITGMAQKYINMSISKTINLPNSAKLEEVKSAFYMAYLHGLKGVTVYRDGCRENQTIQTKSTKNVYEGKPNSNAIVEIQKLDSVSPIKRKGILTGKTFKDKIACGYIYNTVNTDEHGNIIEIFVRPGKHGGCQSNVEAIARMMSLSLRTGTKVSEIIDQLKGIKCPACLAQKEKGIKFTSCADAISRALEYSHKHKNDGIYIVNDQEKKIENYIKEFTTEDKKSFKEQGLCEECGSKLAMEAGCRSCKNCGWSKCG